MWRAGDVGGVLVFTLSLPSLAFVLGWFVWGWVFLILVISLQLL